MHALSLTILRELPNGRVVPRTHHRWYALEQSRRRDSAGYSFHSLLLLSKNFVLDPLKFPPVVCGAMIV
jgi:hypothetical protein